jgi:hypothetical protein
MSKRTPFDPEGKQRRLSQDRGRRNRHATSREAEAGLLSWRLDWREYFLRFCEDHGGNGIDLGDRIVFDDGWSYSSSRYEGPEWPPPPDPAELRRLMIRYWAERRGLVADELRHLQAVRRGLKEAMVQRSSPIMRKRLSRRRDGEGEREWFWEREEVKLNAMDERIAWLASDVACCEAELLRLNGPEEAHAAATRG